MKKLLLKTNELIFFLKCNNLIKHLFVDFPVIIIPIKCNSPMNFRLKFKKKSTIANLETVFFVFILQIQNNNLEQGSFLDRLMIKLNTFYHIWSLFQWSTSLITLIILYYITGHYYNKWLSKTIRGKWLSIQARLSLIAFDLLLNLGLGLYYMDYRDTVMGEIMMRCPIAISPFIFLTELICVSLYYLYFSRVPLSPTWINFRARIKKNFWKN